MHCILLWYFLVLAGEEIAAIETAVQFWSGATCLVFNKVEQYRNLQDWYIVFGKAADGSGRLVSSVIG